MMRRKIQKIVAVCGGEEEEKREGIEVVNGVWLKVKYFKNSFGKKIVKTLFSQHAITLTLRLKLCLNFGYGII